MPSQNHIATPEDFRQAAEIDRHQRAERIVLPKSGLAVLLARPSTRWFLFHQRLPLSLAARAQGTVAAMSPSPNDGETPSLQKIGEARELAEWIVALVQKTVVEPRLSLNPGPGEISPDWLAQEDVDFIIRYAVGEVMGGTGDSGVRSGAPLQSAPARDSGLRAPSADLAPFRRQRELSADRADGGDISSMAVGTARDGPDGFPD